MSSFLSQPRSALDEVANGGHFIRTAAGFREIISNDHSEYKPEAGRYHLYVSYACPWATRCIIVRQMLGLEGIIGLSVVHPTWQMTKPEVDDHAGWVFRNPEDPPITPISGFGSIPCSDCIPDTVNGFTTVRQLYEASNDSMKKFSVPVLWDKTTSTIVNNESSDIIAMFASAFAPLGTAPDAFPSLFPSDETTRALVDTTNEWVYSGINNGVYKCGFAKSQSAYEAAATEMATALDRVEDILSKNRYLCGSELTVADVRLFVTLIRFDEVYVVYFKCNKKAISEYPNMRNYLRELWQMPSFRESTNMDHIKRHYYTSHKTLNTYSVIPVGPNVLADLALPHDRERAY